MTVLAIDPGYGRCGMAILSREAGKDILVYSVCVETKASDEFTARLRVVVDEVERLLRDYRPDCLAMERLFFNTSKTTALKVAEVRGAILSAAGKSRIEVFEYTPSEVKSATASSGRADKKQIIAMLHMLLKIEKVIRHDDEYDAIAVGVTHLARHRAYAPDSSRIAR